VLAQKTKINMITLAMKFKNC